MEIKNLYNAEAYKKYVNEKAPKSNMLGGILKAWLVGGIICVIGQTLRDLGTYALRLDEDGTAAFACIFLVLGGAFLTATGVYDRLGKFAGAGSIVPITGFANSIVAPAMEYKSEGWVLGVGAKMFTVAGPVLVYGFLSSVIAGVIYLIMGA